MKTNTIDPLEAVLIERGYTYDKQNGKLVVSYQGSVYLESVTSLPEGIKFENQGAVDLRCVTSLPEGIKFENQGNVYLESVTSLPEGIKFENQGYVDLESVTSLPEGIKFENQGNVYLESVTSLPEGIKFENQGYVDLESVTSLPEGIKFENQGAVDLASVTRWPEGIKFENQGAVNLASVTSLPEGIKFENQGAVNLASVTSLPEGIKFENQGNVDLASVTGAHGYRGRVYEFLALDGFTMLVEPAKKVGQVMVMRARYLAGGEVEALKECFVARSGDYWAHGESMREAISDVAFKALQASADVQDIAAAVKKCGRVSVNDYRILTGACSEGCRRFMADRGLDPDAPDYSLSKILDLTRGAWGHERFAELVG